MDIQIIRVIQTHNGVPGYAKIKDEQNMKCYVPIAKKVPILDGERYKTATKASNATGELAKAKKEALLAELA